MHVAVCYLGFSLDLCFDTRLSLQTMSGQQAVGNWSLFHPNNAFFISSHTWLGPICKLVHGVTHFEDERFKHHCCRHTCTD